jgi:probable rRNA maturation factor
MTRRAATAAVTVDIVVQSPLWKKAPKAREIVRDAIGAATDALANPKAGGEVAVVLTDDAAIRILNRDWRSQDKPTNVLSFPAPHSRGPAAAPHAPLGDIVIAYETVAREAKAEGKRFAHHLAHLAVHGFLHLFGFDHETARQAAVMERRERDILAALGMPDPYATRS